MALAQAAEPLGRQAKLADSHLLEVTPRAKCFAISNCFHNTFSSIVLQGWSLRVL